MYFFHPFLFFFHYYIYCIPLLSALFRNLSYFNAAVAASAAYKQCEQNNSNKSDNNIIHPTNEPNLTQCNVTEPKQNICSPCTLTISVKQEEELRKCTLYLCALSYAFMFMHIHTYKHTLILSLTYNNKRPQLHVFFFYWHSL